MQSRAAVDQGGEQMSTRKSRKSKPLPKPNVSTRQGPKDSVNWEEHGERVREAVAFSTDFFTRANVDNIAKASSAVAAKKSYFSGMIEMLEVARHALGFWGADQILLELERLNIKRCQSNEGAERPEAGPV